MMIPGRKKPLASPVREATKAPIATPIRPEIANWVDSPRFRRRAARIALIATAAIAGGPISSWPVAA